MTRPRTRTQPKPQPRTLQELDQLPILPCCEDADWRPLMAGIVKQAAMDARHDPGARRWLLSDEGDLFLEVIGLPMHPDYLRRMLEPGREPPRRRTPHHPLAKVQKRGKYKPFE